MIEFCDVSFCYKGDDRASLQHVNLQIKEGEVVVLCGKSGCGKSTLIRLINGLIPFYYGGELKGEVRVSGHQTKEGDWQKKSVRYFRIRKASFSVWK